LKKRLPIDFKGLAVKAITKEGIKPIPFDEDEKVVKDT
jgi:20S proteasome subunit beta 4